MSAMVEVQKLHMRYGSTVALSEVSFQVARGEVLGFLGPNGAGKTTVMKILTTVIFPTAGTALIGGHDVQSDALAVRKLIGYLPEHVPLYNGMQVDEYLRFVGQARGLGGAQLQRRIDWVVEHCALKPVFKKLIHELSRGYRQRVGLGQALIHDPQVLILDEPTTGLDPLQIIEIRKLIRSIAKEKAILFSTHILSEAESISDRLAIIHLGSLVAEGTLAHIKEGYVSLEEAFIAKLRGQSA